MSENPTLLDEISIPDLPQPRRIVMNAEAITRLPAGGLGLADVRSTSASYFFLGGTTASLNAFARRNFTTVLAGIWMGSPV